MHIQIQHSLVVYSMSVLRLAIKFLLRSSWYPSRSLYFVTYSSLLLVWWCLSSQFSWYPFLQPTKEQIIGFIFVIMDRSLSRQTFFSFYVVAFAFKCWMTFSLFSILCFYREQDAKKYISFPSHFVVPFHNLLLSLVNSWLKDEVSGKGTVSSELLFPLLKVDLISSAVALIFIQETLFLHPPTPSYEQG